MSEGVYENSEIFKDDEPDAMKNTDIDGQLYANVRAFKPSTRDGVVASVHVQWWKRPSGVAAVCLGLLCVLLLAGIIGLSVQYSNVSKNSSAAIDQLQTSYNTITKERDQLQTSYNNLTKERDQLQTSYNNMTKERDLLQTERDVLSGRLSNLKKTCPEGWQKLESSWYFLSTETKTWEKSRQDCLERGADLVIIKSDKEKPFPFKLKKRVWIGLTDSDNEGTWKWVDGTPLTTGFWYDPQPDNGEEDCVEIHTDPLKAWNYLSCSENRHWICGKGV
ncbi:C-type lectin domain family 4 member E-like [Oncorhynchus mykiss]|uniref:C-type lectin domain family 4 member E-like n=1 Tax=Oncorhynchus mykiss TaxID=8022 RepID=UPI001877E9DE|nr:C-type lectin domain family 4 member E-like [Oncorhynchus mykiss]XP_036809795.1 C-type lectin domain family 4 member E-like [Oncorhynchus mykiss]